MALIKRTKKTDTASAESSATTEVTKGAGERNTGAAFSVLVRPIVSEKSTVAEGRGAYTFVVSRTATKVDIKNAVRAVYGVQPTMVRVMNFDGKAVRFGARFGRRQDWKKAIVTLPEGKTIDIHAGV